MNTEIVALVFQVAYVDAALKHYTEVLGFSEDFRIGDYAGVKLGKVAVHQSKYGAGEYVKPIGSSVAHIFCDEVDDYFAEVQKKGAR